MSVRLFVRGRMQIVEYGDREVLLNYTCQINFLLVCNDNSLIQGNTYV